MELKRKALFNENGDTELSKRRLINGNTTNLNDFNNVKYTWTSDWYRQAMNNFWIPEEINLTQDAKDYRLLETDEKTAYDKILSFLIFLDSLQTANLPNVGEFITANEVNLCLTIQAYQEAIHSQSYGYILDTICSPEERSEILYQWKNDPVLLARNQFIGDKYNDFYYERSAHNLAKTLVANYILEGIYFYSGFMFFYALGRIGKMPGTVQEIRYINRDENTHLWLFRSILMELKKEEPQLFTDAHLEEYREMIRQGVAEEIRWADYVLGDRIRGLTKANVDAYLKYLGNLRSKGLGLGILFEGFEQEPDNMAWVSEYADPNAIKTDFFEAKVSAYSKAGVIEDDL
ncbi:MAG: ribonucleotide-diphosphate reductase subunit beta [Tissierellia bacterium]|nr:ribonucleotide-diphosphate reductase subunit beta [Tissierellia bacterium]